MTKDIESVLLNESLHPIERIEKLKKLGLINEDAFPDTYIKVLKKIPGIIMRHLWLLVIRQEKKK